MTISYSYKDKKGETEISFGVRVNRTSPVEQSEVEILDVCVNGTLVPSMLEDDFINMVGREYIEEQAVMKYVAEAS